MFRTRLRLAAADLTEATGHPSTTEFVEGAARQAERTQDGYAGRDVLAARRDMLPQDQKAELSSIVEAAGLGAGALPEPLLGQLTTAMSEARHAFRELLEHPMAR